MPNEEALTLSGHNVPLKYTKPDTTSTSSTSKRKRRRKVMWYNPPYSKSVSTNIGREFLNILTRNFPPHHKYHKLFNRNKAKITYSSMPNMRTIIKGHNLGILNPPQIQNEKTCNCRDVKYSTSTELSKKYCEIKNDGKSPNVS